jgi:uncharacterized protein
MPQAKKNRVKIWLKRIFKTGITLFVIVNLLLAFHAWKFTHFYNDPALRQQKTKTVLNVTKSILFGSKAPKSLVVAKPDTAYETIQLKLDNNLAIEGWVMRRPKPDSNNAAAEGTMIMFHGHGSQKGAILPEAMAIYSMGYNIVMVDFRSHGNSEGSQCTVGIKETEEVQKTYNWVTKNLPGKICLYGISLGAATIVRAVHEYKLTPHKLILEMPFGSLKQATEGKLRMMNLPQSLSPFLCFWGGTLNGVWAFGHNINKFAKSITCPVLHQWGIADPRVKQSETNEIFNNISSTQKKLVVYQQSGHESLIKKEPAKWLNELTGFLK